MKSGLIGANVTPETKSADWLGWTSVTPLIMEEKTYLFLLNEAKGTLATYQVTVNADGVLDLNLVV